MKYLVAICMLLSFLGAAAAEAPRRKSAMEDVVEVMVQSYLQSATQELAVKALNDIAVRNLGENMDGKLGEALAIYSIYQNVNAYNDATSESQRYQAAAHLTATGITMVAPPVGAIVQAVVFFQDLAAAYIFSSHKVEFAKLQAEVVKLHRERSDITTAQFSREMNAFNYLIAAEAAIRELILVQKPIVEEACTDSARRSPKSLPACIQQSVLLVNLLRLHERSLAMILQFNGRMVNISMLVTDEKSQQLIQGMQEGLVVLRQQISEGERNLNQAIKVLSELRVAEIDSKHEQKRIALRCEGETLRAQARIAVLTSKKEKASVLKFIEEIELEQAQIRLKRLLESVCAN